MPSAFKTVLTSFEDYASSSPERRAIGRNDSGWLSYGDLNRFAEQAADVLAGRGISPGDVVGIGLGRSVEAVVSILAVWKLGATYVPVDPAGPKKHRDFVLDDSAAQVVIVADHAVHQSWPTTSPIPYSSLVVANETPKIPGSRSDVVLSEWSPAWILYTSGSTGKPKGVIGSHGAIAQRCTWLWAEQPYAQTEIAVQNTALTVVDSVWEIWGPLAKGIPVVVLEPDAAMDTASFIETLAVHNVSRICMVPTLLRVLMQIHPDIGSLLPSLNTWVVSGEALDRSLADEFHRVFPGRTLYNQYGLTESCADVTSFDTSELASGRYSHEHVPIGRPQGDAQIHILDEFLRPVPVGERGELFLSGQSLANGYVNNEELTRDRFFSVAGLSDGRKLLRTGDLCLQLPDGNVQHLGRLDRQVKIRGFRVEPENVESLLRRIAGVADAAVIQIGPDSTSALAAYFVPTDTSNIPSSNALRQDLSQSLPDFAIPTTFHVVTGLPKTGSGKIDFPRLSESMQYSGRPTQMPAEISSAQRLVWSIYVDLLGDLGLKLDADFFKLGGHSLLIMQLISKVEAQCSIRLRPREIMANPTISGIAALIENAGILGWTAEKRIDRPGGGPSAPSQTQTSMWLHEKGSNSPGLYNIQLAFELDGEFDEASLELALNTVVSANPALRTVFKENSGTLTTHAVSKAPVRMRTAALEESDLTKWLQSEAIQPFDLEAAPLIRTTIAHFGASKSALVLTVHHLACDGQSIGTLLRQLSEAYERIVQGLLPARRDAFGVRDVHQRRPSITHSEVLLPDPISLATDRPRPTKQDSTGTTLDFHLGANVALNLKDEARRSGFTTFEIMCTAFAVALGAHSDQERFVISVPLANTEDARADVGCFMRTVPLEVDLRENPTLDQLVRRTQGNLWKSEELPDTAIYAGSSRPPQVMFAYDEDHGDSLLLPGVRSRPISVPATTSKLEVTLFVDEGPGYFKCRLEYSDQIFTAETMSAFRDHFLAALGWLARDGSRRLNEISVVSEQETRLLQEWNATGSPTISDDLTLNDMIEGAIARGLTSTVACGEDQRTHSAINSEANQVARCLVAKGLSRGDVVGVHLDRSIDLLVVLLGVLKAGCAYVPLQPDQPFERLRHYIQDSSARVVVTTDPSLLINHVNENVDLVRLGSLKREAEMESDDPLVGTASPDSPAYVIFTSGSTGRPKGVVVPHRALVSRLEWMQSEFGAGVSDCILQKTPIGFDVSVWELFWPFISGSRLEVALPGGHLDPGYLVSLIEKAAVSYVHFVPSMLQLFLEHPEVSRCVSLKAVFSSGEALAPDLAAKAMQRLPGELYNYYGPTEAEFVCIWPCSSGVAESGSVPIGRPIANSELFVYNTQGDLSPIGVPGELYIGGTQLASGYIGRPDITSERFVPHPFKVGQFLYRTGDAVRWCRPGYMEYLGRLDRQIKIAGIRVEPAEIEELLRQHSSVKEAVVLPNAEKSPSALVAFVVTSADQEHVMSLRDYLRDKVPSTLVPSEIIAIPSVPQLSNGKLDRQTLMDNLSQHRAAVAPRPMAAAQEPSEGIEEEPRWSATRKVWESALRGPVVGETNFVGAGGDSVTAIRATLEINQVLGAALSPYAILKAETFTDFMETVSLHLGTRVDSVIEDSPAPGEPSLTSAIQERWFEFAAVGRGNVDIFVEVTGPVSAEVFTETVRHLSRRHSVLHSVYKNASPPIQVPVAGWSPTARTIDLSHLDKSGVEEEVRLAVERSRRPFDIAKEVPFEIELLTISPLRHLIIGHLHHIATDGWSESILVNDFEIVYSTLESKEDPEELATPPQYSSYAASQRRYLSSPAADEARRHWRGVFDGAEGPTTLPRAGSTPGGGLRAPESCFINSSFASEEQQLLLGFARSAKVTLFNVLLSAFALTLKEATGSEDVIFGTSTAGRGAEGLDLTMGVLVSPMPIRVRIGPSSDAMDVVADVNRHLLGLSLHQDYPLLDVIKHVPPFVGLALDDVFSIHFIFQSFPKPDSSEFRKYKRHDFQDLSVERPFGLPLQVGRLMRDLEVIVFEHEDGELSFNFGYNPDTFRADQIASLVATYRTSLLSFARIAG